ncbi:MAG: Ig-like domain-containing protein, partial [Bacteroidota bacterium]|nr:Ig-like domain-containing protein [Bacteroidota bacterium]
NDSDIEDDLLVVSATLITAPSHGNLVLNQNQTFTYTPDFNYVGSDSFVYELCDDGTPSMCSSASVNIDVKYINYPPIAIDIQVTTSEDEPILINVMGNNSDPDGDEINLSQNTTTPPQHGKIQKSGNGFLYTPDLNYFGTDSFVYRICDNGTPSLCATATVYVAITPINDAPIAIDDFYKNLDLIARINGNVLNNDYDIDGDNLSINTSNISGPSKGKLTIKPDGNFTYTPNHGQFGEDEFKYFVCDDGNPSLCSQATVYLTVSSGIPKGFSPNGDNVNDHWIITGIEEFPNNTVLVLNRSGEPVYEMKGYDNINNVWSGNSNKGLRLGQNDLPDGTYFYLIDLGNGSAPQKGYIVIKR